MLATLPVLFELPLRPHEGQREGLARVAEALDIDGLAIAFDELGLVVKRVHLRRATVHKQKDDTLGLLFPTPFAKPEGVAL